MTKHSKLKDIEVIAAEHYGDNCLGDATFQNRTNNRRPKGWVEIWEVDPVDGSKKLLNKSNLIVYLGREMLVQRLFDEDNISATPTKDEFLYWMGFGTGGVRPADPLISTPPTLTDTDLNTLAMISASDANAADYHVAGGVYPETGNYKYPFDSVVFERDYNNEEQWLIGKITTTLGTSLANGKQLSEAGLYTAESRTGGYGGQFSLFARVTFPTLIKTVDRRIVFIWYIYT
jgi:hypothetical protein